MLDVIQLHLTPTTTFALTNVLDNTNSSWNRKQCDMFSIRSYSKLLQQHSVLTEQILSSQQKPPLSTDVVDFVLVLGEAVSIGTPSDGTITL